MGRVKRRIRHDFKSERQEKNEPGARRPVGLAIMGIASAIVLFISYSWIGDDDPNPPAEPERETVKAVFPDDSAEQRTRVPLTLPPAKKNVPPTYSAPSR